MRQLRIFYITSSSEQELQVEVYPDIFSVRDRWLRDCDNAVCGALIHIGHDRPTDKDRLISLTRSNPGRVLVTEPCRWSLPFNYRFSPNPISKLELHKGISDCSVYVAVDGFGYSLDLAGINSPGGAVDPCSPPISDACLVPDFDGWLGHCIADNPSVESLLVSMNICSSHDFDLNAAKLSEDTLKLLRDYREWFTERKEKGDVVARILGAHPSLRSIRLNPYLRTVRLKNVFDSSGINNLGDLLKYSPEQLLTLQNFGRTSLLDLHGSLDDILRSDPHKQENSPAARSVLTQNSFVISSDWIGPYLRQYPASKGAFDDLQITNDISYRTRRNSLSESVRDEADGFRFRQLIDTVNIYDPVGIVSICPDWFLKQPIDSLALSIRVRNVLGRMNIVAVEELTNTTSFDLERQRNFGRKSLLDLSKGLIHGVKANLDNCFRPSRQQQLTLRQHIEQALDELKSRTRQIMLARLGFGYPKASTLEEVAATHGLTRERIRQIEKKVVESWIRCKLWDDLLIDKLRELTIGRKKPLLLDLLVVEDRWFDGFSHEPHALFAVIEKFASRLFHIYPVNDVNIITRVSKEEWEEIIKEGSSWIRDCALPNRLTRSEITGQLSEICRVKSAQEFERFLLDRCLENLHFASDFSGSERLIGFGRSVENLVRVVLEESVSPLHFTEIYKRCQDRTDKELDVRRVSNACGDAEDILLFGRGTYGVSRHLSIADDVRTMVREICEEVISSGSLGRQWHCVELLDEIEDQLGPMDFDSYVLDLLLLDSPRLTRLGRQVWILRSGNAVPNEDRSHIHDLALKALHEAGRPMKTRDLLQEIAKIRGVRLNCQLHPTEYLTLVEPNLWGLPARDIPASAEQRRLIQERMFTLLSSLGRSLHLSEFSNHEETLGRPAGVTDYMTYSICKADRRFHGWSGGLLGLEEWGEPRGFSVSGAFQRVLESLTSPKTSLEIQMLVEEKAGRKIDKIRISALLAQSSCQWDPDTQTWAVPIQEIA